MSWRADGGPGSWLHWKGAEGSAGEGLARDLRPGVREPAWAWSTQWVSWGVQRILGWFLLGFSAGPEFFHIPRSREKSLKRRVLSSPWPSLICSWLNPEGESAFPGVASPDLYRPLD